MRTLDSLTWQPLGPGRKRLPCQELDAQQPEVTPGHTSVRGSSKLDLGTRETRAPRQHSHSPECPWKDRQAAEASDSLGSHEEEAELSRGHS